MNSLIHFHFKGPNRIPFFSRYAYWASRYLPINMEIQNLPAPCLFHKAKGGLILSYSYHQALVSLPTKFTIYGPLKDRSIYVVVTKIDFTSKLFMHNAGSSNPVDILDSSMQVTSHPLTNTSSCYPPILDKSHPPIPQSRSPYLLRNRIKPAHHSRRPRYRFEDPPSVKPRPKATKHPPNQ